MGRRKRKKMTRPPSTVLEEIEKENKLLGIRSDKKQNNIFFNGE
jgi:hypothetical protein